MNNLDNELGANGQASGALVRLILGLLFVFVLLITDMIMDVVGSSERFHLVFESASLLGISGLLIATSKKYWNSARESARLQQNLGAKQSEIEGLHDQLVQWKTENQMLVTQFNQRIDDQFDTWDLSNAQRQIARKLLTGQSLKMIAFERKTSEATVRQQASDIYKKSGNQGRTELAAWFLQHLT